MFNQFSKLFQTSLKPIDKLVELNISTASIVAHQQGLLIASLIDDSLSYSRNISSTTDITKLVEEQSKFSTGVQSHLTEAIKKTSGTLTKAQNDAEEILSESFSALSAKTAPAVVKNQPLAPKVATKPALKVATKPAVKVATKPALKVATKPAPKVATKPALKVATKPAPKAEVKAAPKAEVKAAPKAEVKAAPKAEVKAAPKAEVKAAPKAEVKIAPKAKVKAAPKAKVKAAPKAKASPKK